MANFDPAAFMHDFLQSGTTAAARSNIGLSSVDDTSDTMKPVSIDTQAALDLKADETSLQAHIVDVANPHAVTAAQAGAVDLTTSQTVAGAKTLSGQLELTGQTLVGVNSAINAALGDVRYGAKFNTIIKVTEAADFGVIDSTVLYMIDGMIDMGTTTITIPATGIYVAGLAAGVSGLTSSEDNYTMFSSLACGNIVHENLTISVTGASSQVYNLKSNTGFDLYNSEKLIYLNCTSLGELDNFSQALEVNITRLGGSPSLTLTGAWLNGFRSSPSLVRSLDAGMTEPLFKAGTGFVMGSRFLTDLNCDLPVSAALTDFAPANFVNSSSLMFSDTLITRNGALSPDDANITPNIAASDLVCAWSRNTGMPNTFVGAEAELTTEIETVIVDEDVAVDILGTWTPADLQHFDSPSNGQLRHLGVTPVEYSVSWDFIIDGSANAEYRIELIKDAGGVETIVHTQTRVINNLQGGRDVGYFTGTHHENLCQNDFTFWRIVNTTGTQNCTIELSSTWDIDAR